MMPGSGEALLLLLPVHPAVKQVHGGVPWICVTVVPR